MTNSLMTEYIQKVNDEEFDIIKNIGNMFIFS